MLMNRIILLQLAGRASSFLLKLKHSVVTFLAKAAMAQINYVVSGDNFSHKNYVGQFY